MPEKIKTNKGQNSSAIGLQQMRKAAPGSMQEQRRQAMKRVLADFDNNIKQTLAFHETSFNPEGLPELPKDASQSSLATHTQIRIRRAGRSAFQEQGGTSLRTFFEETKTVLPAWRNAVGERQTGLDDDLQRFLEERLGYAKNRLHRSNDAFWDTYYVEVPFAGLNLNILNPEDLLRVMVLSRTSLVAIGEEGLDYRPLAEWVMEVAGQEEKEENRRINLEIEATKAYTQLTAPEKAHVLAVSGQNPDGMSGEGIDNAAYRFSKNNPQQFIEFCQDPNLNYKALIARGEQRGVLRRMGRSVLYGDLPMGESTAAAIEYLQNNQDVAKNLEQELQNALNTL